MITKVRLVVILAALFITGVGFANNGQFDVRFSFDKMDCKTNKVYVDLEIKATSANSAFNLSEQNFRFSFNEEAVNANSIQIEQAYLTGFVAPMSYYGVHTLTGSKGNIVSYNVELTGGDGVLLSATEWTKVGKLSMEVTNPSKCVEFIWHTYDAADFPNTFIGEKNNNQLMKAIEGNYINKSVCVSDYCRIPSQLATFEAKGSDCSSTINWSLTSENAGDVFVIERSKNGINFKSVGSQNATGENAYQYTDANIAGAYIYRVKLIGEDGTVTYSASKKINAGCEDLATEPGFIRLFPNPVIEGNVTLQMYSNIKGDNAVIEITDISGKIVMQEVANVAEGMNTLSINPEALTTGTYFATVRIGEWTSATEKFVKAAK